MIVLLAFFCVSASAKVVDRIVVIINNEIITLSDIDLARKRLNSEMVDDTLLQLYDQQSLKKDPKALKDYMIDERIIDGEVKKQGLEATIERVEQEMRETAQRNGISRAQLVEAVTRNGTKFSDYQAFVKTGLQRQSLIQKEIISRIKISDEDISTYYLKEKGIKSSQVFEYDIAHILFLPQNGGEAAAKERAESTLKRLKNSSTSFDKMASQYSEDPNFAQGGFLGSFKAGEMIKEIEAGVRGLPAGEISEVVRTRIGFHILKVLKRTLVEDPAIASEKDRIRGALYTEAFKKQLRLWLDRKREEAFIRVNTDKE